MKQMCYYTIFSISFNCDRAIKFVFSFVNKKFYEKSTK